MEKEIFKKKELMVVENIKKIDVKKKEITFSLKYASYLKCAEDTGEKLLKNLIAQQMDYFSDLPIRGLALTWMQRKLVQE